MDLTTTYLGLSLKNPLVASASPLTRDIDNIRRLEDAGAAAVVLPLIFEEQIRHEEDESERLVGKGADSNPETMSYFPATAHHPGPQTYLDRVLASATGRRYPGDRQPERHHRQRLDRIRKAVSGGRSQRTGRSE